MLKPFLAAAMVLAATAGHAATLAANDFDAENGGVTALNYAGYSNLSVVSGSTDLIANADYGIYCAGSKGACVDLDGTTNSGGQLNTGNFAFTAGGTYTFSFDLSGNQRGFGADDIYAGFRFSPASVILDYSTGGGFGDNNGIFTNITTTGIETSTSIGDSTPFTTFSIRFTAGGAGSFFAYVGTGSTDNVGPVLDNVLLVSDVAAVPEPATWGLMLAGFALVGVAARRRSALAA